MRTQPQLPLLLRLVFLLSLTSLVTRHAMAALGPKLGGYQPIRNPGVPYVVEIGRFAVAEHNKVAKPGLAFVRVVSGEKQVVAGTNYRLIIEADGAGARRTYQAVVYDRPWENVRTLTSFQPLP